MPESAAVNDNIRALETLLARKRRAGSELLSMDFYERYGAQHDTPENVARMAKDAVLALAERTRSVEELTALVERLRREDPSAVERWADAHDEYLRAFIATCAGGAPQSTESIGAFTAEGEREEWAAVKRGEKPFVDENVYYIPHMDRDRCMALFGVEP